MPMKILSHLPIAGLAVCLVACFPKAGPAAPVVSAAPSAPTPGAELCRAALKTMVSFNDPDSVRINSVEPNEARPGRYRMYVSAKNAMGGYGDPIACTCGTGNGAVTDMHCDSASGA